MNGVFKKDSYLFGSILGIGLLIVSLLLIYVIMISIGKSDINQYFKIYLLSVIPNILVMRYYLKVLAFEKTGKAVLFVTFILFIAYFYYQLKK
jgi:hypothetical protein